MLVGLDIGSSSAKAIVIDAGGRTRHLARRRFGTRRGPGGRVEHDAEEIVTAALTVLRGAARALPETGGRLGLATQRSTALVWDRDTGRPLTPAWSWQDVRAADFCRRLAVRDAVIEADIARRTGLRLSPHYAAPKLARALRDRPELGRALASGRALWGPLATFLVWRLTRGAVYALDHANAQRTLLLDLGDLAWDGDLAARFGLGPLLDAPSLPALVPTRWESGAEIVVEGRRLVLAASTGDQQAALEGLRCRRRGDVAINYGSGAFVLIRVGGAAVRAPGLLTSLADSRHAPPGTTATGGCAASYVVEGTVNAAATALDWVQRRLAIKVRTADLDRFLGDDPGAAPRAVHFLPAVAGVGAPRWDAAARPRFVGRTAAAGPRDLLAAAVESIAQRCAEIVRAAARSTPPAREAEPAARGARGFRTAVRVSGGLTRCRRLLQVQADLLQQPVLVGSSPDATALGAALLAAAVPGAPGGAPDVPPAAGARHGAGGVLTPRLAPRESERLWRAWERAVYGRAPGAAAR
jgi:glycerol kinase